MKNLRTALCATTVAFAFAGTAYAEGCDKIIFSDVGWTDITANTAATSLILEALGYETETKVLSVDRKSTRLNSSHLDLSRMPSSA